MEADCFVPLLQSREMQNPPVSWRWCSRLGKNVECAATAMYVLTRILTSKEVQSPGYGKRMKYHLNERMSCPEWIASVKQ